MLGGPAPVSANPGAPETLRRGLRLRPVDRDPAVRGRDPSESSRPATSSHWAPATGGVAARLGLGVGDLGRASQPRPPPRESPRRRSPPTRRRHRRWPLRPRRPASSTRSRSRSSRAISTTMSSRTATNKGYRGTESRPGLLFGGGRPRQLQEFGPSNEPCAAPRPYVPLVSILAPTVNRAPHRTAGADRSAKLLDVRSSWPLTARSAQLDRIARWSGDHQVGGVVLTGPAGVGKTRLGEEVLERRLTDAHSRAVGHPATQPIPLGALAHLLPTDLARDLGTDEDDRGVAVPPSTGQPRRARRDERLVLLVDDVDQLDDTSLALLLPLTIDRTLFVVATLRAGQPTARRGRHAREGRPPRRQRSPTLDADEIAVAARRACSTVRSTRPPPTNWRSGRRATSRCCKSWCGVRSPSACSAGARGVAAAIAPPLRFVGGAGRRRISMGSTLAARETLDVLAVAGTVGLSRSREPSPSPARSSSSRPAT